MVDILNEKEILERDKVFMLGKDCNSVTACITHSAAFVPRNCLVSGQLRSGQLRDTNRQEILHNHTGI
jgi:hypothetical protein